MLSVVDPDPTLGCGGMRIRKMTEEKEKLTDHEVLEDTLIGFNYSVTPIVL